MKKILLKTISLFTALLSGIILFLACSDEQLTIIINEHGGSLHYEYYVDKEIADEYFGENLPEGLVNCNIDEIKGKLCYIYSKDYAVDNFDELENELCNITFYGEEGMNIFSSASVNERSLLLKTNPCMKNIENSMLIQKEEIKELAKLSLTITMPYEIEEYSGGTLSEDKKTFTITLSDFDEEKIIKAKCINEIPKQTLNNISAENPTSTPNTLLVICSTLFILETVGIITAICIFFVKRRRQKRAESMPETPIDKIQ